MPRAPRGAGPGSSGKKGPKPGPKEQVRGIHTSVEPGPHGELVLEAVTHDKRTIGQALVRPKHSDKAARAKLTKLLDRDDPKPRLVGD